MSACTHDASVCQQVLFRICAWMSKVNIRNIKSFFKKNLSPEPQTMPVRTALIFYLECHRLERWPEVPGREYSTDGWVGSCGPGAQTLTSEFPIPLCHPDRIQIFQTLSKTFNQKSYPTDKFYCRQSPDTANKKRQCFAVVRPP